MKVELCDFCGDVVNKGEGMTLKIWKHFKEGEVAGKDLWGKTYRLCLSCSKDLEKNV